MISEPLSERLSAMEKAYHLQIMILHIYSSSSMTGFPKKDWKFPMISIQEMIIKTNSSQEAAGKTPTMKALSALIKAE